MKNKTLELIKRNLKVIGVHYEKYRTMMIVVASIVAAIAIAFLIYWDIDKTTDGAIIDNTYLVAYNIFLGLSVLVIACLVLNKFKIVKTRLLAIIIHAYSFILIVWGTLVCILDLYVGVSPFVYLIILTTIAGLFVIAPIIYSIEVIISLVAIIVSNIIFKYEFFKDEYMVENIVNLVIYAVVIIATTIRHYRITMKEYDAKQKLEELTYNDELTGLLNERSYINFTEEINENIKNNDDPKFAVILMDVNNLKATNDAYGHRYGCHLIVRCGHTLPNVFKSSKLFHVGGDEFIAVVLGEDFDNLEKLIEEFKKTFDYSLIEFDGHELIFSVAHGEAIYQKGDRFQDVLQRADKKMYQNKKELKEKYGMESR